MKVIVAGGGKTLYYLCRNMAAKGSEVTVINQDRAECTDLAENLTARVICGDPTEPSILADAGGRSADAVIAITPQDHKNLVICQLASMEFSVARVVALANDPDNVDLFQKMGIPAFSTTHIVSSFIEQRTFMEHAINLLPVGEGKVNVTEIPINEDYPVVGRKLKEIRLPLNGLVAVIIRDERAIIPGGEDKLQAGDKIVTISLPESYAQMLRAITNEE